MPYSSQEASLSAIWISSSIHMWLRSRAVMVTCERWLWAPRSEISFEQGQTLVTGAVTRTHSRVWLARGAVLDAHRVPDVLDPDPVDRERACVGARLHVLDLGDGVRGSCGCELRGHTVSRIMVSRIIR